MKKQLISTFFLGLILSGALFAASVQEVQQALSLLSLEGNREEQSAYPVPEEIKIILDKHASTWQELLAQWHARHDERAGQNVMETPLLPGYFIKYGIERVSNAQRLKKVIDEHKLNLLSVAEKYLYHVPGRPMDLS